MRDDDYTVFANRFQSPTLDVIARGGGYVQAHQYRPRAFGYCVSARAMRARQQFGVVVPWGWTVLPVVFADGRRDVWLVGPWWLLWPLWLRERWYVDAMPVIVHLAVEHGLARLPSEGCYYHEIEWFPDAPKFR